MSNISLIATDLDGTLFYDRENISKRDREAIFSVHENGTAVALATGRELPIITPALDRLALWDAVDYIIMAGGAQIYTAKTQKIHTVGMLTPEILCDVYHRYQHHPISIILPRDNIFFTNRVTRGFFCGNARVGVPLS